MTLDQAIERLGIPTSPTELWLAKARCIGVRYDGESDDDIELEIVRAKLLLAEHRELVPAMVFA